MGNCCGPDKKQIGEVTLQRGGLTKHGFDYFDERPVAGMKGRQKEQLIVKLQAHWRGAVTRKTIKQKYGFQTRFASFAHHGDPNYANPRV